MSAQTDIVDGINAAVADPDGLQEFYFSVTYTTPDNTSHACNAIIPQISMTETDGESVQVAEIKPVILKSWCVVDIEIDGTLTHGGSQYVISDVVLTGGVVWEFVARG